MQRKLKAKVLRLVARGKSPNEVAAALDCHPAYVRATKNRAGLAMTQTEFRIDQIHRRLLSLDRERLDLQNELKGLSHG